MPRRKGLREDLERIRAHVDALFEDALVESGYGGRGERPPGTWSPSVGVVETDGMVLEFKDEMSQAVMKPAGADGYEYTYVIMPMRI